MKMANLYTLGVKALGFMLLALACAHTANAQQRNLFFNSFDNVVRLDFNTSPPTPFPTGIEGSYEGIAHYEDGNGNLLFWFNSNGVYDAFNGFMGGSLGIFANSSSAEINICPVPGNPDQYYIIYNQETCTSLWYSVVDMSLNGGLGDVIDLNTSIDFADFSEGLEIVRIPCTNHYWLIGYQCGTGFKRFLIDENGISPGTVIHPYPMPAGGYDGRGETDYHRGKLGACFAFSNNVFVADFDPETGELTNPVTLSNPSFQNSPFGVEFSPSGNYMYFTLWYTTFAPNVFQYNLATGALTSYTAPGGFLIAGLGEIELGRDGRLYIIQDGGTDIVVIENPDDANPTISTIAIPYPPGAIYTGLGISDHIQSDIFEVVNTLTDTLCITAGETVTLTPPGNGIDFEWVNASDTSNVLHIGPDYSLGMGAATEVFIATSIGNAECFDIVEYTLIPFPDLAVGPDITISEGESTTLNASTTTGANEYIWFPGTSLDDPFSATPTATPNETTVYSVAVHNEVCYATDTIVVTVVEDGLVYDTLCHQIGIAASLAALDSMSNVSWANANDPNVVIATGSTLTITTPDVPTTYVATGDTPNGASMDYLITIDPIPDLDAGANATVNEGESIQLSASGGGTGGYSWLPDDGSLDTPDTANPVATPLQTTTYTVSSHFNPSCPASDQVTITVVTEFDRLDSLCAAVGQPLTLSAPDSLSDIGWALASEPGNLLGTGYGYQIQSVLAEETVYVATGKDQEGNTVNIYTTVYSTPALYVGNDITLYNDGSVQLNVSGGGNYAWEPAELLDDPGSASPTTVLLAETTNFYVTNTTDRGCKSNAAITVFIRRDPIVLLPTAFSPNGDNINDELKPRLINIASLETFVVYNRWGQKVFETNDPTQGWDGTHDGQLQNTGVYAYLLRAAFQMKEKK